MIFGRICGVSLSWSRGWGWGESLSSSATNFVSHPSRRESEVTYFVVLID